MKHICFILWIFLALASCNENDNHRSIDKNSICARWLVAGTSDYVSFEFNESGNFLVVKRATAKPDQGKTTLFGTYSLPDKQTIELTGLGTVNSSSIDDRNFSFKFSPSSGSACETSIQTTKSAVIAKSKKTTLLCRTWEMVSINNKSVKGSGSEATVLFTDAGTYYIDFANPGEENEDGLANWCWKDSHETILCYSWDGETPTCDDESQVKIIELTNNVLIMEEDGEVYQLKPASVEKSAFDCPNNSIFTAKIKKGFWVQ
jgi:hypothetical protein